VAVSARTVSAPRPTLLPTRTVSREPVTLRGSLGTRFKRPAVLQRKVGSRWANSTRKTTSSTGAYTFQLTAPSTSTYYRVAAGAVRYKGKRYAARVSPYVRLTVVPRSVTLPLPRTALAGVPPTVVASATPVRSGRQMLLQRRSGADWTTVATGKQGSTGKVSFAVPIDDLGLGPGTFRARVPAVGSDPQVVSPSATLTVGAPGAITAPAAGATVSEEFPVKVVVDPAVAATGVSLFVDGHSLPDAVDRGGSVWEATVDPAKLDLKRKHVSLVAVVRTAKGRGLTTSIPLTIDAPGGGGLPPGFRIDTVASGFDQPTSAAVIDSRRTLVTEKSGIVKLVTDGVTTTAIDLRDRVMDHLDSGLLTVELDPDFEDNGWFYLSYVLERDAADKAADPEALWGSGRVARYTLDGATASPSSEHVVLGAQRGPRCFEQPTLDDCLPVKGWLHTVDDLLFEPDGSLLVSVGDGAAADTSRRSIAQQLDALAGKVLRIDPRTGRGRPDNPYFESTDPGSNRSRVLASGFRNPFRLATSSTGEVFVGDVGEVAWEEVNRVVPGKNYGWPCFEGPTVLDSSTECDALPADEAEPPMLKYGHSGYVGSLTLGAFPEGDAYPSAYAGKLFYADYVRGEISYTDPADSTPVGKLFATPPSVGAPVDFTRGPDGTLWYVDIASGSLREIVHDPDSDTCSSEEFLQETFRNRTYTPEPDDQPWGRVCVGDPPSGPALGAPNDPNQGQGWSMRWLGRPQLGPGTYRLTARASGSISVKVNGAQVPDGGTFKVSGSDVNDATAEVEVRLANNPAWDSDLWFPNYDPDFRLGWERTGTGPSVSLAGVPQGVRVQPGTELGWTASATDAQDGKLAPGALSVKVTLIHYGGVEPHEHPSGTVPGPAGAFTFDDAHAPGRIAYRLTAVATDSSGWTSESPPVYVCLAGGNVGPCG
jgi:glucose/arabinose dehydrogenase